jgi:flavonoid 3',5'-hydroxylase
MDILPLLQELLVLGLCYCLLRYIVCLLLPGKSRKLPPGPRGYPVVGALPLLGPAPHVTLARFAKRYGPIMHLKMGQHSMVVASTAAAARVFLKTLDVNFANRPVDTAPKYLAYGGEDMVFAEYGPKCVLFHHMLSLFLINFKFFVLKLVQLVHMLSVNWVIGG